MKYNPPPGSQDPNASFVNGIPGIQKGSPVPAGAVEYPQREILAVIEAAGIVPSNEDLEQLLKAIRLIIPPADPPYEICEFYPFRHPSKRPGFEPALGGVVANAATAYPIAWDYLQTTDGQLLCVTESEWQAMTTAVWHTNADNTTVGWNGIGGAPFFVQDLGAGTLRLPDLRGMYMEAAGYDGLGVGYPRGDESRRIFGTLETVRLNRNPDADVTGALYTYGSKTIDSSAITYPNACLGFDSARVVPVGPRFAPARYGTLACVYLGKPAS